MESPVMAYAFDVTPNYSYIFEFENEFIHSDYRKWMTENWTVAFYYVGVYMAFIFGGQYYMQNRPRFELRRTLMIWNCSLAAFSIMGACRTLPEFIHVLRNYGIYHSICVPSFIEQDKVSGFWTWMFVLSKLPELGDTVFIVLRKKPLIFLHWYHHITVLLYTWYSFTEYTSSARWFVVMNYCVHRKGAVDYEHLTKKIQKYERRLRRLYPPSHDATPSNASTSYEQTEYTGIEPEDWLQDSPEIGITLDETTAVPNEPTDPEISVDPIVSIDPENLKDKPCTSQEASGDTIDADLDQDTMVILGEDPSTTVKYGPDLHKEITKRFQHIATEGFEKDCRKALIAKYLVPSNCTYIAAPALNAELKAAIPEATAKRDKAIVVKQEQMASAISCLGQVITSQLIAKNNELLPKLMDTARILCDIQHYDSVTRRNFILSALKRDMKDALSSTKIDAFLFGDNLSETIKSAKAVTKSGTELKPDTTNKNPPRRPNNQTVKYLNRRAPAPARRPLGAASRSREPAATTRPPPPPASSSKRLPPQRQPQRRY